MPLTKVTRNGQVTLPAEVRKALRINEGDYFETEVIAGAVVLKPNPLVDREQAWERLMQIIERPKWHGPGPEPSEDELMEEVVEDIHAMRHEHEGRS